MLDPYTLFDYAPHIDPRTIRAHTLVLALATFGDAGHVAKVVGKHLVETLPGHRIGSFDADQLIDYRDERGTIHFSGTSFGGYRAPSWDLYCLVDEAGEQFLLLTGPEPGLQWERFCAALAVLAGRHDVVLTIALHGISMPVPHTRPVVISTWATDPELLGDYRSVFPPMNLLASFQAVLSQRFEEQGRAVLGFGAHVPHFLSGNDYPDAAIAVLREIKEHTRLDISTMQLAIAADAQRAQLATEVEASEEIREHVEELERNYDEFLRRREIAVAQENMPNAEQIGQAAEEFLRSLDESSGSEPPAID